LKSSLLRTPLPPLARWCVFEANSPPRVDVFTTSSLIRNQYCSRLVSRPLRRPLLTLPSAIRGSRPDFRSVSFLISNSSADFPPGFAWPSRFGLCLYLFFCVGLPPDCSVLLLVSGRTSSSLALAFSIEPFYRSTSFPLTPRPSFLLSGCLRRSILFHRGVSFHALEFLRQTIN